MSARLMTPTGRPDLSMTGAPLKPLSVRKPTASRIVATSRIDSGFGVMRSAAVCALSARLRRGSVLDFSFTLMAFLTLKDFLSDPAGHDTNELVEKPQSKPC